MKYIAVLCGFFFSYSVQAQYGLDWKPRTEFDSLLPQSLKIYEYRGKLPDSTLIRAFCVVADLPKKTIDLNIHYPDQGKGLETTQNLANEMKALVAINGGFFKREPEPNTLTSNSLLVRDRRIIAHNSDSVRRENTWYYPTRSAFGLLKNKPDVAWIKRFDDKIYEYPVPHFYQKGLPTSKPNFRSGEKLKKWKPKVAIGGGPVLITEYKKNITDQEELFRIVAGANPRTAIGYTDDRKIIIIVVDGRQEQSQGVTFDQLAEMFLDFKVKEAINLDGGGSTTLVVNGKVLNNPSDKTGQRKVGSILYFFKK